MLRPKRRSALVASAAVFAALFAVLGLVPISRLVGIPSFITFREAVSPLGGMLFGPAAGLSVVIGVFLDFGLGRPVAFLGLDFAVDLAAALVAGLSFTGRRKEAVALSSALIVVFLLSPGAAILVDVNGVPVPFVWMHALSVVALVGAFYAESKGRLGRLSWEFIGAVTFASTMSAHMAGGILTEYVYLANGVLFSYPSTAAYWSFIFYLYPVERVFITVVGTAISVPVLRALAARRAGATAS